MKTSNFIICSYLLLFSDIVLPLFRGLVRFILSMPSLSIDNDGYDEILYQNIENILEEIEFEKVSTLLLNLSKNFAYFS